MTYTNFFLLISSLLSNVIIIVLFVKLKANKDSEKNIREEFRLNRAEFQESSVRLREEVNLAQKSAIETIIKTIGELGKNQTFTLEIVEKRIIDLNKNNEEKFDKINGIIEIKLKHLQESNEKKLDEMRLVVDEKLQSTLEKRLGESFKQVSERLEAVQQGLGEMKTLATGVGDLKRVLTNVKARGTWGEVQLEAILEQILTVDQYQKNVATKSNSSGRVEFAVKLPGAGNVNEYIWLPIDSKFPQEDFLKLEAARDAADSDGVKTATAALIRSIKESAKDIATKYIDPPNTTDFAILFLPTEGLYAEVLRQSGIVEELQQSQRVVIAGPTTLSAILNSLRMGFRTLAIEKQSSEVWKVLAAVKTEFGKFGDVLEKVKKQLQTASNTIDETGTRTRAMQQKLKGVEAISGEASAVLLNLTISGANSEPNETD